MLFVKQKTAYEMRISDWSSDVCSSDLVEREGRGAVRHRRGALEGEDHIDRGERRAVVPLHALAEFELPGRVVDRLPRLREPGNEPLVLVRLDEGVEDVRRERIVRAEIMVVRIDQIGRAHV